MIFSGLFPPEVISTVPRITMTGDGTVLIEQHQGVMGYQEDCVTLHTACGVIHIRGEQLCLGRYTSTEAEVSGKIVSISWGGERK